MNHLINYILLYKYYIINKYFIHLKKYRVVFKVNTSFRKPGMLHGTPGTSRGNVTFFPEIIPDKFPGKIVFPNKIFFISHVNQGIFYRSRRRVESKPFTIFEKRSLSFLSIRC